MYFPVWLPCYNAVVVHVRSLTAHYICSYPTAYFVCSYPIPRRYRCHSAPLPEFSIALLVQRAPCAQNPCKLQQIRASFSVNSPSSQPWPLPKPSSFLVVASMTIVVVHKSRSTAFLRLVHLIIGTEQKVVVKADHRHIRTKSSCQSSVCIACCSIEPFFFLFNLEALQQWTAGVTSESDREAVGFREGGGVPRRFP